MRPYADAFLSGSYAEQVHLEMVSMFFEDKILTGRGSESEVFFELRPLPK